jgi:hypothetical protein
MYIYLEFHSNIYITKMYGTMNIKYCDVLSRYFYSIQFFNNFESEMFVRRCM